jgi:S-DNA-T family DNA segregation ATPase FtsK/SpoIIIE
VVRRGGSLDLDEVHDGPLLVVVDDAELVDDASGALARRVAARTGECTVMAAARADALRHQYGHWTAGIRQGRVGLVAAADADLDGDLLGAALPRRAPVRVRPGLWWVLDHDGPRLVQVARPVGRSVGRRVAL